MKAVKMAKVAGRKLTNVAVEVPRRLSPTADTLRRLYLLSGNNCAIAGCKHVIIDRSGAVVGEVCHIESAMPDGPRFNASMTNEERRSFSNLVLLCATHHKQVDHKGRARDWTPDKLWRIKAEHEAKFIAIGESIQQAFEGHYRDNTDDLNPTVPSTFARLDELPGMDAMSDRDKLKRKEELPRYLAKLQVVPNKERSFMLAVLKRWKKTGLTDRSYRVSVDVYDLESALSVSSYKLNRMGLALQRLAVGGIHTVGFADADRYHFCIYDPSESLLWVDIIEFCNAHELDLESFVMKLNFGQLD